MATLVSFHAHPDDESIATGGVMAKAAAEGHRVVLVVATKGENGEVAPGFLEEGEALWQRRVEETLACADVLGVARTEFLGYIDSGMMGTPENDASGSFWQADVDDAAQRLAAIMQDEHADVLLTYDDHGNYGHPDHIQVHRVGVRAAELAGTPDVYEATMNRDETRRMIEAAREHGADMPEDEDPRSVEFGTPEAELTTCVDVSDYLLIKREAMAAHASQISETSWLLSMPAEAFAAAFGREWFIHRGVPAGVTEDRVL
jgi:LmbE family N-acetylglucosaminyl deacetylase